MLKREELGVPSFWALQAMGWSGFYLLLLLTVLPYHKEEEFRNQTICCITMFLASCLMHPFCRSLLRNSLPWLVFELRAFVLSAAIGAIVTFVVEGVKLHVFTMVLADFLDDWLTFTVVLFLWCTLYFSIRQWQQAARERERLLRADPKRVKPASVRCAIS